MLLYMLSGLSHSASQRLLPAWGVCYDPGPYFSFSAFSADSFLHSWSLIPHLFPHALLGLPPSHLTILQSTITCYHSAVCSIPQHHYLTCYGLQAHDALSIDRQLMMELYLDCQLIASSWWTLLYVTVTPMTHYILFVYKRLYFW